MAHVQVHDESVELDSPMLVEGLPGVGLVGKIAADHLVQALDMTHYASCHCDGLPEVAVYGEDDSTVKAPVRVYADEENDLLVLQSDVPVSPSAAKDFAGCVTGWFQERNVTPLYLSGLPREKKEGIPELYGVATGTADGLLADHDIGLPTETGFVSGPTGALLYEAERVGLDSLGLVVESNKNFPDPEAARIVLVEAILPLTGVSVDTDALVEQAEDISDAREQLAKRMQEAEDESSQAQPTGMFQ
jgi:uncharacterized protein